MLHRLTKQIALTSAWTTSLIVVLNYVNLAQFLNQGWTGALSNPAVWGLALVAVFFAVHLRLPNKPVQIFQVLLFLLLSGPMVIDNSFDFFGLWFFLLSVVLLYRYGLLERFAVLKLALAVAYFLPFLVVGVLHKEGVAGSFVRITNYSIFLATCISQMYFIFEEPIRELLASNRTKDARIVEREAEIARLEPLSVLGERVGHVAHSFKNNLSQVATALYYLETNEAAKATEKIQEFLKTMNDRIEDILMVSQSGLNQKPETFDAARVLAGLNQVYLSEPAFVMHARMELEVPEPTPLLAVRWDFLMLAENILKNALEAIMSSRGHGTIRLSLSNRVLTLANDGGPIPLCGNCRGDCLNCTRYGRPGRTTKEGGSGHGLSQVFAACRKYGWSLRIRNEGTWSLFEVTLGH